MGLLNFLARLLVPDPPAQDAPERPASPKGAPSPSPARDDADEPGGESRWASAGRPPERKGKRWSSVELEAERSKLAEHMIQQSTKRNAREFAAAKAIGATHYIWHTTADGDVCPGCLAREGKKFRLDRRPVHGHPGEAVCGSRGYCICWAEVIVPDFI